MRMAFEAWGIEPNNTRRDYLEILTAREHPPMRIIVKNLWTFLASMLFGARRAEELLEKAAAHEQLHERGALRARINMDLGLLYKLRGSRAGLGPSLKKRVCRLNFRVPPPW